MKGFNYVQLLKINKDEEDVCSSCGNPESKCGKLHSKYEYEKRIYY
jgi:hypothetical protein